jgi:o-succinylbenzoate synthase
MIRFARLLEQRVRLPDADDGTGLAPAADARGVWSERRTLVLVAEDGEGHVGLGEAAPLPGYSLDSLDQAWDVLVRVVGVELGESALGGSLSLEALARSTVALASGAARFAVESAVVDLWSRRRSEPAWALLAHLNAKSAGSGDAPAAASFDEGRAVAALFSSAPSTWVRRAERAIAEGIGCFKLKLGVGGEWADELEALRTLRRAFPDVKLRVDANQSLSPEELWQRLPALRELELEWLEEPTARFPNGIEWPVNVPLALDETLQETPPDPSVAREHGVRAYVLKPTTLGGFVRSLELARDARAAGIAAVASHAYEGPVGFSAVAALSLGLGAGRPDDGLDRHAGVADWPALPAFDAERRRIRAWREPGFGISLAPLLEKRPVTREVSA